MKSTVEEEKKRIGRREYITLFFSMLYISAFTFGGGFVIASFVKKKFVDELKWIDEEEMLDMIALAQSCPGAIAVNVSILVGKKIAGAGGVFLAVLGTILPPMAIMFLIAAVYEYVASNYVFELFMRGMQIGVAVIILHVAWGLLQHVLRLKSWFYTGVLAGAFILVWWFKINVVLIISGALMLGIIVAIYIKGRDGK